MSTRRNRAPDHRDEPTCLVVPRAEAAAKIQIHLDRGVELRKQLREQPARSYDELEAGERAMWHWSDYTQSLLEGLFNNPSVANSTRLMATGGFSDAKPLSRAIELVDRDWDYRLGPLQSVLARLDTYQEPPQLAPPTAGKAVERTVGRTVFVVHGHDNEVKETVARFLTRLDLTPIILHEQPDMGRTIIEKFEERTDVGFAVVLLTPDDVGAPRDHSDSLRPRAPECHLRARILLRKAGAWKDMHAV